MDIQLCYVMLKTALFDSLLKDEGVNSRKKLVLDGADFDFSLILEFAVVIHFAAFSSFMSWYSIKHAPIIFILSQKLWHIYRNKVWNWRPSWIFFMFLVLYTYNNGLPWCIMCLSDSLTKKYRFRPQNHDPTWSNFRDIWNLRFWGGHFEKWLKLIVSPSFFFFLVTSLIWFLRVPWTKWYHSRRIMGGGGGGGGCTGTPVSSRTILIADFIILHSQATHLWAHSYWWLVMFFHKNATSRIKFINLIAPLNSKH